MKKSIIIISVFFILCVAVWAGGPPSPPASTESVATHEGTYDHTSFLAAETDPTALLTAGTDNVKDTHIDWGTGAGEVSADDISDGSTNAIPTLAQETEWDAAADKVPDGTDGEWALDLKVNTGAMDAATTVGRHRVYSINDQIFMEAYLGPATPVNAGFRSIAVADLGDTSTPSALTALETTNTCISNYKASGADHVFTMPAAHAKANGIFMIGDEFQVDIEPPSGTAFRFNGVAMAGDEHIVNSTDTLATSITYFVANINGTLTYMFQSSSANWAEATPP